MRLQKLLSAWERTKTAAAAPPSQPRVSAKVTFLRGDDDLEVVGESHYQGALWAICGGSPGDRVRYSIQAVLMPEPSNVHDSNAIAVQVNEAVVGYLSRDEAASYGPGLRALMARHDSHIGLSGIVVGGGYYPDGPGRLGVWLHHDASDFGLSAASASGWTGPDTRRTPKAGSMRTGFSEAWLSDLDDDSYDLSWFQALPDGDSDAILVLKQLLKTDPDPIDRHYQFSELEARLYRCRDSSATALDEFDDVCRRHDAEMDVICEAFLEKWDKVPLLDTYRQMAVRQQKLKNWQACLWWTERGLFLYGNSPARQDAVEDLLKRRNRASSKLELSPS